jgi:CheY-like chemotaxis protein
MAATGLLTMQTKMADVLIVEDDRHIRQVLRTVLEMEGYDVATAENGREALDWLSTERAAMILLDLNMPVMDGWELNRRMRAAGLDQPVVFMTAGERAEQEARQNGVAGYLGKPFNLDDLLATVARFVPRGHA